MRSHPSLRRTNQQAQRPLFQLADMPTLEELSAQALLLYAPASLMMLLQSDDAASPSAVRSCCACSRRFASSLHVSHSARHELAGRHNRSTG
jgi:hypothetical protein